MASDKDEGVSPEVAARRAMGKTDQQDDSDPGPVAGGEKTGAAAAGGDDGYFVPPAGLDPDSVQRVVKHLPGDIAEKAGLGARTPEELSDQRTAYGVAVNAARNPQGPRAVDDASDEEKAARTGQPLGDGKAEGAPSADDPDSDLREGKLTADDRPGSEVDVDSVDVGATTVTEAAAARREAAAGDPDAQTRSPQGRASTAKSRTTAAGESRLGGAKSTTEADAGAKSTAADKPKA